MKKLFLVRGFRWGFIIGLIIAIIETIGVSLCEWNPVEGSVVPDGLCQDLIPIYFPWIIPDWITLVISPFVNVIVFFPFVIASIVFDYNFPFAEYLGLFSMRAISFLVGTFIMAFMGLLFEWIILKIKYLFLKKQ